MLKKLSYEVEEQGDLALYCKLWLYGWFFMGSEIERSEFAEAVEENAARYHNNKELYRTRQEINEHI